MAVINELMDAAAELGRNPVSKHQIQPEYGDEQADADGFAEPVSRQPLISILRLNWCLLTGFLPSSAAASFYSFITAIRHRASPEFIGSRNCVPMAFTAESPPARGQ